MNLIITKLKNFFYNLIFNLFNFKMNGDDSDDNQIDSSSKQPEEKFNPLSKGPLQVISTQEDDLDGKETAKKM